MARSKTTRLMLASGLGLVTALGAGALPERHGVPLLDTARAA